MIKLKTISPEEATKLLSQPLQQSKVDAFTNSYTKYVKDVEAKKKSEEHLKTHLRDFLLNNFYKNKNEINTKNNIDLVIHLDNSTTSNAGVLIEVKRPSNVSEMISLENPNRKALHELILYYFDERKAGNNEIKYLVATNFTEWFIINANEFDAKIYNSSILKNLYQTKINDDKTNLFFYPALVKKLNELDLELNVIHWKNDNNSDFQSLYKLFSPDFLLKLPLKNDSNSLNKGFYDELLHIIGLVETGGNVKLIERKKENERFDGSLLESVFFQLDEGMCNAASGNTVFEIALELVITWVNRILFLKLLEAQLISYHPNDPKYKFLNTKTIKSFDELNNLFFKVLAVRLNERHKSLDYFEFIPYLNSSLFEKSEIEQVHFPISQITEKELPLSNSTILKTDHGKKRSGKLQILDYLFQFLDSYDFGNNTKELQKDNKPLIKASVLGLIFEKINGYKDGSFFTPGSITMYMCNETLRRVVVLKFNEIKNWNCETFIELQNKIIIKSTEIKEANEIVNSIRICDPAVGSGHFLVSALNEMIAIKYDLKILCDKDGVLISHNDYQIEIKDDELVVTNDKDDWFVYKPTNKESSRVQETLFREKHTIIENCLFGVDINPNSVKICQLRLWIELLKNAYYNQNGELETLPNIDINIKCGNSLISRFDIKGNYSNLPAVMQQKLKIATQKYKDQVIIYKITNDKKTKARVKKEILELKQTFSQIVNPTDPDFRKLRDAEAKLVNCMTDLFAFEDRGLWKIKLEELNAEVAELKQRHEEKLKTIYANSLEWRFEFPEVLNDDGDFVGFDVVIGNPPYIQLQNNSGILANQLQNQNYETFVRSGDIYCIFYERGMQLLRDKGLECFITSNKWMRAGYGEKLRNYFSQYNPLYLNDIGANVFENATVDTNILLTEKANNQNKLMGAASLSKNQFSPIKINNGDIWTILSPIEQSIKEKVEKIGTPLKDWDIEIYRGVLTGFNEAFIIDTAKRDELVAADPKSTEIIKPILRGRDIKRYSAEWAGLWIIATFPAMKIDIDKYPAVRDYLLTFGKRIHQSGETGCRKKTNNKWFETQDQIGYYEEFEKEKIVFTKASKESAFAYDNSNVVALQTAYIATGKNVKLLLPFLNSKLISYCFNKFYQSGGIEGEITYQSIIEIPIPHLSPSQQQPIIDLVEKILAGKKALQQGGMPPCQMATDIAEWETEIDNLVYGLYGLSWEEVRIIEKGS